MNRESSKIEYLILVIYAFVTKFLVSINSIRFSEVFTDTDQAIFFSIGKAMLNGKVLYKDVFDHKTPYIYFFNAFASLFEKNHIGLFIIEVTLLSIILVFNFKLSQIFISKTKSFLSSIVLAVILSIPHITFSYSRTEMYAIAFIIPAIFLFAKYFVKDEKLKDDEVNTFPPINMFIIGILATLTFMTNIRAVVIFVPFAVALLIKLVKLKELKNLFAVIVSGLLGVIITILPYIIYAVITESVEDAIYAIIVSNVNYARGSFTIDKNTFEITLTLISENIVFFIFVFISLLSWFFLKIDKYLKYSIITAQIITIAYVIFSNRTNPYYLVILMPYLMSIYFLIIRLINLKLNLNKTFIYLLVSGMFLLINVFMNKDIQIRYLNCEHRAQRINNAISTHLNKENIKVLSYGFNPETYIYTGGVIDYKYFIIPNIPYSADRAPYIAQYEYIMNRDPDVVVYANSSAALDMPQNMFNQIRLVLSTSYELVDEFKTNEFTGTFYIFIKKP